MWTGQAFMSLNFSAEMKHVDKIEGLNEFSIQLAHLVDDI